MTTNPDPIVQALLSVGGYDDPTPPNLDDYKRAGRLDEMDLDNDEFFRRLNLVINTYAIDCAGHAMLWGYEND